jgi:hypothetical protein
METYGVAVVMTGPTLGASSDVVLCPDVVARINDRSRCCALPWRRIIYREPAKTSSVIRARAGSHRSIEWLSEFKLEAVRLIRLLYVKQTGP